MQTSNELSVYNDNMITVEVAKPQLTKVTTAFPDLSREFIKLLIQTAIENNFTAQRFLHACNNVILNCKYPKPTIADFLSFDRKIKLLTYSEVAAKFPEIEHPFEHYFAVKKVHNNIFMYAHVFDIKEYKLPCIITGVSKDASDWKIIE